MSKYKRMAERKDKVHSNEYWIFKVANPDGPCTEPNQDDIREVSGRTTAANLSWSMVGCNSEEATDEYGRISWEPIGQRTATPC